MRQRACGGTRRLGVKGDAEAGGLQHRQIVGAVADRQRLREREAQLRGEPRRVASLASRSDDRLAARVPVSRPSAMSSSLATSRSKPSRARTGPVKT